MKNVNDLHGKALMDYLEGKDKVELFSRTEEFGKEEMPVEIFFREWGDLNQLEKEAINQCKGRILDVGAGAGAITLILQEKEADITALESSDGCVSAMKILGVQQGVHGSIWDMELQAYDTILLIMNGIGLAGTIKGLDDFIGHLFSLLNPGGQILFDSSDLSYLYNGIALPDHYLGELRFRFEYNNDSGPWFPWLYMDSEKMKSWTADRGYSFEVIQDDGEGSYLGRIQKQAQ